MKNICYLLLPLFILGCNPKNIDDCLKTEGSPIERNYETAFFDKIITQSRVKLFIQSSTTQSVIVKTGDNLIDDVKVSVNDENTLLIENNNGCNIFRDFEQVRVFVSAPNITSIRNGSGYSIESIGVLDYPDLTLISEDGNNDDLFNTDGDFILQVNSNRLEIVGNNISNFFLSGETTSAQFKLFGGDGRIDAPNLVIQNLKIFHRGSNVMIVNPQQSITGELRSTGDVISLNRPPTVDVEEFFSGQLIFKE